MEAIDAVVFTTEVVCGQRNLRVFKRLLDPASSSSPPAPVLVIKVFEGHFEVRPQSHLVIGKPPEAVFDHEP